jgi:hypothetical protein
MGVWDTVQTILDGMTDEQLGISSDPAPTQHPVQVTQQLIEDAVADLVAGDSYVEIAQRYGVKTESVARLDQMRLAEIAERTAEPE